MASGIGECPDGAVLLLAVVESRTRAARFAEEHGGVFHGPGADQFLAIQGAVLLETRRISGLRSAPQVRPAGIISGVGRRWIEFHRRFDDLGYLGRRRWRRRRTGDNRSGTRQSNH